MDTKTNSGRAGRRNGLIIAGAHRSGTSAITRVCNLLGVELGPDMLPPGPDNPRGYWEHRALLALHQQVLKELGSSWDDCRALPKGWRARPSMSSFEESLQQIIERDFANADLWGAKDPRLCRLMPLWKGALAKMRMPIAYVIVLRHPLEVASSLCARNGFALEKGLLLWLRHNLEMERHSRGESRVFVGYDDLLANWRTTMENVAAALSLTWPVAPVAIESQVNSFLTPDLRHHAIAGDELSSHTDLPELVDRAYRALCASRDNDAEEIYGGLDDISTELAKAEALYDPVLDDSRARNIELKLDLKDLRNRHGALERRQEQMRARVEALRRGGRQAKMRVQKTEAERDRRELESARLQSNLTELEHRLSGLYASPSWRLTNPLRVGKQVLLAAPRSLATYVKINARGQGSGATDIALDDPLAHVQVEQALVDRGRIYIAGWAFHEARALTAGVMIFDDHEGESRVPLQMGGARGDVHAAWGIDNALNCGFGGIATLHKARLREVRLEFDAAGAKEPLRARIQPKRQRLSPVAWLRSINAGHLSTRSNDRVLFELDARSEDPAAHLQVDEALIDHGALRVGGWAFHEDRQVTAGAMIVSDAKGERRVPLELNIQREDVQQTWEVDKARFSGFRGVSPLENGRPKAVRVEFDIADAPGIRARVYPRRVPVSLAKRLQASTINRLFRGEHALIASDNLADDPAAHLQVDQALISQGTLRVGGWAFHEDCALTAGAIILTDAHGERRVPLHIGATRDDVYEARGDSNAKDCGFWGVAPVRKPRGTEFRIEFELSGAKSLRAQIRPRRSSTPLAERLQVVKKVKRLMSTNQPDLLAPGSLVNHTRAHLHVDQALVTQGRLELEGWAFHEDHRVTAGVMIFAGDGGDRRVPLRVGIARGDVQATWNLDNALRSGFWGVALLQGANPKEVRIEFDLAGAQPLRARIRPRRQRRPPVERLLTATPLRALSSRGQRLAHRQKLEPGTKPEFHELQAPGLRAALDLLQRAPDELPELQHRVDIVIPVYDGFDYLEPLFRSIRRNTRSPHRLIVIDDASPDDRVWPRLQRLVDEHPSVHLLRNETNRGFVRSVNRAATHVAGDFVLLNTDVEVPAGWLERLMTPIQADRRIASTTPFSNAATICGFPDMPADNPPFAGLDVECIDRWFRRVRADLPMIELPTGIGFCMGVNGDVWRRAGAFDEKTFGQGYGEENDWCLRAMAAGYASVMAPNLFVHHKHGGSFAKDARDRLRERNLRKVIARYPKYPRMVESFVKDDPTNLLRQIMTMLIACGEARCPAVLIVDHELGGGANAYRQRMVSARLAADQPVLLLAARRGASLHDESVSLRCVYRDYAATLELEDLSALDVAFARYLRLGEIFINNLVIFKRPLALLHALQRLRQTTGARLTLAVHDFYALCPSYNLLNAEGVYCRLPDITTCRQCLPGNRFVANPEAAAIEQWRGGWGALLKAVDTIICFSEDSRRHLDKIYPDCARKIEVRPHQINVRFTRKPHLDRSGPLHIGVVGAIGYAKGSEVVAELARYLLRVAPTAKITVIGILENAPDLPNLTVTGSYEPEELPDLLESCGVNVCLVPSIWPETFSYVTAELMALGVPIACFDVGAPAQRMRQYGFGALLSVDEDTGSIVEQLRALSQASSRVDAVAERA